MPVNLQVDLHNHPENLHRKHIYPVLWKDRYEHPNLFLKKFIKVPPSVSYS